MQKSTAVRSYRNFIIFGQTMEELSRELLRRDYTVLTTEAVATDDAERLRLVIARLKVNSGFFF